MDVIDIIGAVARRWLVVLAVLLVTASLAFAVIATAESEYSVSGSLLLTDASLLGGDAAGGAGAAPRSVSPAVIAEIAQGDEARLRVQSEGATGDYVIETGAEDVGLLRVRATATTEAAAVSTAQLVLNEIQRALAQRQQEAGVPEGRQVTAEVLASPTTARNLPLDPDSGLESAGYVATGSLRLVGPTELGGNPYASSLAGTVRVLEEVILAPQTKAQIAQQDGGGTYEVGMRSRDSAPIIYVDARGSSPQAARDTFDAVVARLEAELERRQELAGAAPSSWLTFEALSVPSGAALVGGQLRRPLIVIVGLGVVAAVSLAVLIEGLAARSRASRPRPPGAAAELQRSAGEHADAPPEPVHYR